MLPKLISIGSFYLPTYGVMVALAFLAGLWITVKLARRNGLNPELVTNLAVYVALAGMLGAKILMIVFDWYRYMANPARYVLAGHAPGRGRVSRRADPGAGDRGPLYAQARTAAAGHLGRFRSGTRAGSRDRQGRLLRRRMLLGNRNQGALGSEVPRSRRLRADRSSAGNPTASRAAIRVGSEALVFGFLYWRFGRQHAPGQIIGLYLVLSSVLRFFIEFTRNHEQALPFGLPLSITQWIAIGLAAAGAVLLVRARRPAPIGQPVHA